MKFRAMIKKSGNWWIGWLIDLPGVNAQEKTREELLESLKIGAEDMLSTAVPFEAEAQMTTIEIPSPGIKGTPYLSSKTRTQRKIRDN
jgi:predicted RNase H-like HicB family nuclease